VHGEIERRFHADEPPVHVDDELRQFLDLFALSLDPLLDEDDRFDRGQGVAQRAHPCVFSGARPGP
jgi:hypothetical protein